MERSRKLQEQLDEIHKEQDKRREEIQKISESKVEQKEEKDAADIKPVPLHLFRPKAIFKKLRKNLKPLKVRRRKTPPPPKNNQQRPPWKKPDTKKEWQLLKLNLPLRG